MSPWDDLSSRRHFPLPTLTGRGPLHPLPTIHRNDATQRWELVARALCEDVLPRLGFGSAGN